MDVTVFDMTGKLIKTVTRQIYAAGPHALEWDGRDSSGRAVSSGTYLLRMKTDAAVVATKALLVR